MERKLSFLISVIFHFLVIFLALTIKFPEKPRTNIIYKKLKGLYAYIPPKATMPPMPYIATSPPSQPNPPEIARPKKKKAESLREGKREQKGEKEGENLKKNEKEGIFLENSQEKTGEIVGSSPGEIPKTAFQNPNSLKLPSGKGGEFWNALSHLSKYIPKGSTFSSGSTSGRVVGGSAVFETGDYDITPWAEKIIPRVKGNWIIPLAAKLGFKGVSVIFVVVEKDGRVSTLLVERSSGIKAFDQAAVNAIKSSSPFPPLPPDFPLPNLRAHFLFYYNVIPAR